jgi:outer membrane protein assembly factor BamB
VLLSIDRTTGDIEWERTAVEATPHEGFHPQYGSFASNSPVTDGQHVYASFGSRGLYCYDLEGTLVWKRDLGQMSKFLQFGEGTPLVLHDDRLLVKFDHEGDSFVAALDAATGEELWRADRDEGTSWSPPLVVEHDGGRHVVVAATQKVRSYDFETGELLWEAAGLGRNQIPAPVHHGDLVYVMSGFISPNLMAIRLGERGNLTHSDAIVWQNTQANSYTPSPVLFDDQLYVLTDTGVLTNFDAATGDVHYRQRLPGPSNFKASPVGVNGKLYLSSEEGQVFVVKMGPEFELLATNTLDDAVFIANPAIVGGEIILRSQDHLYAIGGE